MIEISVPALIGDAPATKRHADGARFEETSTLQAQQS